MCELVTLHFETRYFRKHKYHFAVENIHDEIENWQKMKKEKEEAPKMEKIQHQSYFQFAYHNFFLSIFAFFHSLGTKAPKSESVLTFVSMNTSLFGIWNITSHMCESSIGDDMFAE